jgi:hypothetical protein
MMINRVVFVSTPNDGTVLADGDHWGDLVDIYTSFLNLIPDNPVTAVFDAIVSLVKVISVNVLDGLSGLHAMTADAVRRQPSASQPAEHFGIASTYAPNGDAGWPRYVRDFVLDKVLKADNDLIVPTDGVFRCGRSELVPRELRLILRRAAGVSHGAYLRNQRVRDQLLAWLT